MSESQEKVTTIAEVASEGGKARAQKLTAEERSEIARKAAAGRWHHGVPTATHGSPDHPLKIAGIEIPCYVLDDGRRMIVQAGVLKGLGMAPGTGRLGEGDRLAKFVTGKSLNPFISNDLLEMIKNPVRFKVPSGGTLAYGYEATILADLCDAVLEARKQNKLHHQQVHIAAQCEILVRAFTKTGIIALVDEATGYQYDRARFALEEILERFIAKEWAKWAKMFPDEFYREMFRLRRWAFKEQAIRRGQRPALVGLLTKNVVWQRIAPGILKELERLNPRDEKGRRKYKHFQRLTEDIGHPRLREHLSAVIALMRASDDWPGFIRALDRALPKQEDVHLPLFDRSPGIEDENDIEDVTDLAEVVPVG